MIWNDIEELYYLRSISVVQQMILVQRGLCFFLICFFLMKFLSRENSQAQPLCIKGIDCVDLTCFWWGPCQSKASVQSCRLLTNSTPQLNWVRGRQTRMVGSPIWSEETLVNFFVILFPFRVIVIIFSFSEVGMVTFWLFGGVKNIL